MRLTRGVDYGARGAIYLAMQPPGTIALISEIARQESVPESYLAKIFQNLSREGIVQSHRGARGGFSLARPPAEITLGEGLILPALEEALVGMAPGERKTVRLPPAKAFGPYRRELVCEVPRAKLSEQAEPQPGMLVQVVDPAPGCPAQGVVVELRGDQAVLIDGNHHLAGETLVYDLQCVEFVD